jgi:hypothetical protein
MAEWQLRGRNEASRRSVTLPVPCDEGWGWYPTPQLVRMFELNDKQVFKYTIKCRNSLWFVHSCALACRRAYLRARWSPLVTITPGHNLECGDLR